MILTAQDLQAEQEYHIQKRRMHNRCLHGCRVACGLGVTLRRKFVDIEPGMALDCQGNEIVVSEPVRILLPERKRRFFLTLVYTEMEAGPVPSAPADSGFDRHRSSRIRESFALGWSARDPLSAHDWHKGAWAACGRPHPLALAKFIFRHGQARLSRSFEERVKAIHHRPGRE
jgi:hypothetical protein